MKNLARSKATSSIAEPAMLKTFEVPCTTPHKPTAKHREVVKQKVTAFAKTSSRKAIKPNSTLENPSSHVTSEYQIGSPTTLKDWHPDEQPRERLMKQGPESLATSELIAILFRTGTKKSNACDIARDLLFNAEGKLRQLAAKSWRDLAKVHGIGSVKAVTLIAALELGRRRALEGDVERPLCLSSTAAFSLIEARLCDLKHEECWIILLNNASRAIGQERLSIGGLDGTVVDVRNVMRLAIRYNASAFILVHNHPSGSLTPSQADMSLTKAIKSAGQLMNIHLRDHLIIGGKKYYSFVDAGTF